MIKVGSTIALLLFCAAFTFAGINIHEPYLTFLHGPGVAAFIIASFVVLFLLIEPAPPLPSPGKILIWPCCMTARPG
jgi:hypothetical protein